MLRLALRCEGCRGSSDPCRLGHCKGPEGPGGFGDGVSTRSIALVEGFHAAEDIVTRKTVKLIRVGKYAAEVAVDLIEEEGGWSPYLSVEDAAKLDTVRKALRQGDVSAAAKHGRVFELLPVSG